MASMAIADPGAGGNWPPGTVPLPEGVIRTHLRDTDVMDPFLPEELFHPGTGAWIGRGPRPEPAPELWAQVWGIDWPLTEAPDSEAVAEWSLSQFNFEAVCFGVGAAIGSPRGHLAELYCGIVAVLWARLRWAHFRDQ